MSEDIETRDEMNSENPTQYPTLIFIHGAWHTHNVWKDVVNKLYNRYQCLAVDFSNTNFETSLILLKIILDENKNIILIGHSSAGLLMQEVANHPNIEKLVFINTFILPVGLCQFDVVPKGIANEMLFAASQFNSCVPVNEEFVRSMLMNNEKEDDIQKLLKMLIPQHISLFTTKMNTNISQINKSKYYIYCKDDVSMPPGAYKSMANNLGNYEWIECDGGHETIFTNPQRIVDIITKII